MARYTIVRGDTLDDIAHRYGTTYQELAAHNGIADPNVIRADDTIDVPPYGYAADPPPVDDSPFGMDPRLKTGLKWLGALGLGLAAWKLWPRVVGR